MYELNVNERFIFSENVENHKIHPQKGKPSAFGRAFFKQKREPKEEEDLPSTLVLIQNRSDGARFCPTTSQ